MRILALLALFAALGCASKPAPAVREGDLIKALARAGADLSKPRETFFFLYFESLAATSDAEGEVRRGSLASEKGLSTAVENTDDNEWLLAIEADMVVSESRIKAISEELTTLAKRHGGEYDGWEAAAKP